MEIQSVLSMAPLRISFVGGGTDISTFYSKTPGCVISAAINKYVYVHIKRHDPLFQERYRISYSETEHTQNRNDINNLIVRSCLELLNMDEPLQISTSADLPSNSGLGSSSSFAVALLNGLHKMRGEEVSLVQIAEEASRVEIELLKSPIGKQDQYAASFGGLNYFEFHSNETVRIEPIYLPDIKPGNFFDNTLMIWTGLSRQANSILADQASRSEVNYENLFELTKLTRAFRDLLINSSLNWSKLGEIIYKGWELKQSFSTKIITKDVSEIISKLNKLNCSGYKLLGAGGGGFVFAVFDSSSGKHLSELQQWRTFKPSLDQIGARIVSVN
jgi:D-glycero-alpha-D-manno-heptose-7-phosphate kinase